jgi:hypothetical protein
MKIYILGFILLISLPAGILAQFTGGNGRGDFELQLNGSLLGGEDGLYLGGIGRGDIFFAKYGSILNGDIIIVSGSAGADGVYSSFSNASGAFNAINANVSQSGRTIIVTVWGNSTSEAGTYSLIAGNWNSVTIYPKISGLTVSGIVSGPHISIDGASHVTIDGRLNASGLTKTMTISKVKYANSAANNTLKYCGIAGDLSLSESSRLTVDGTTIVGGNVTIETGSNLSTASSGILTVSGILTINP